LDVYLVRHAIAELRDATRWPDDSLRPLSADGGKRFRRAAHGLRRIVPAVEIVLASPYVRAWQTAELLRDEAGWPAPERSFALAGDRPPAAALDALRMHAERGSVALVGHEPNLSWLASLLLAGDERAISVELKKGGVVLLTVDAPFAPGSAVLRWSVSPRILRRSAP
jgi:phosphohistidine phosphatase